MRWILGLEKKLKTKKSAESQKKKSEKKKHSTPKIPAWSPTAILIGPNGA